MKQFEKYSFEEVVSATPPGFAHPAVVNGRLDECKNVKCANCDLHKAAEKDRIPCALQFIRWLCSDEDQKNIRNPVNHPDYYVGKIEVIDYIEDKGLGFCLGNAVKYISRAGKKDPEKEIEDLQKAAWYINRRIEELKEGELKK